MTDTEESRIELEKSVRRELIDLRSGVGISYNRVKKVAPTIAKLRVVDDEMQRNPPVSRSLATYLVICCAVREGVANADFRYILLWTLNVDQISKMDLTERRGFVQEYLGYLNDKNYMKLEEAAYDELRAVLISSHRSPCAGYGFTGVDVGREFEKALLALSSRPLEIPGRVVADALVRWLAVSDLSESQEQALVESIGNRLQNIAEYVAIAPSPVVTLVDGLIRYMQVNDKLEMPAEDIRLLMLHGHEALFRAASARPNYDEASVRRAMLITVQSLGYIIANVEERDVWDEIFLR